MHHGFKKKIVFMYAGFRNKNTYKMMNMHAHGHITQITGNNINNKTTTTRTNGP